MVYRKRGQGQTEIVVEKEETEKLEECCYFGSIVTVDGRCNKVKLAMKASL